MTKDSMTLPTIKVREEDREAGQAEAIEDITAELRSFAMNMRRDDSDARSDYLRFYYEALEQFADRFTEASRLSGYNQGVAEERERAAKVAEAIATGHWINESTGRKIATAIRSGEAK
jgi:hypothetical protein